MEFSRRLEVGEILAGVEDQNPVKGFEKMRRKWSDSLRVEGCGSADSGNGYLTIAHGLA
jgi:hypothetical protein